MIVVYLTGVVSNCCRRLRHIIQISRVRSLLLVSMPLVAAVSGRSSNSYKPSMKRTNSLCIEWVYVPQPRQDTHQPIQVLHLLYPIFVSLGFCNL